MITLTCIWPGISHFQEPQRNWTLYYMIIFQLQNLRTIDKYHKAAGHCFSTETSQLCCVQDFCLPQILSHFFCLFLFLFFFLIYITLHLPFILTLITHSIMYIKGQNSSLIFPMRDQWLKKHSCNFIRPILAWFLYVDSKKIKLIAKQIFKQT